MELTKSEQIRAGLQRSFQSGTAAKASTVCYGYKVSHTGELVIDPTEATIVLYIFHRFMNGDSLGKISDALANMGIASPLPARPHGAVRQFRSCWQTKSI